MIHRFTFTRQNNHRTAATVVHKGIAKSDLNVRPTDIKRTESRSTFGCFEGIDCQRIFAAERIARDGEDANVDRDYSFACDDGQIRADHEPHKFGRR